MNDKERGKNHTGLIDLITLGMQMLVDIIFAACAIQQKQPAVENNFACFSFGSINIGGIDHRDVEPQALYVDRLVVIYLFSY